MRAKAFSFRATSLFAALSLFCSTSLAGIEGLVTDSLDTIAKFQAMRAREFSDRPLPVYKGPKPGRDEARSGWWTPQLRSDWATYRIQKQLEEGEVFEGLFASIADSFFDGGGGSGGGSGPGEGGGGSGGSGGPGGAGGLGGETNTNTGNNQQNLPIVSWSSKGDSGLEFSLWHNSRDNDDGIFGKGWRHSYEASLAYTTGTSAIIKMPDGLVVPYTESSGVFTPPPGWNETLVMNGDGSFTMTFKSGAKFEFTSAGLLSSVKDKSGNTTTVNRDTFGSITSISSVDGRTLTFAYSSGKVSSGEPQAWAG